MEDVLRVQSDRLMVDEKTALNFPLTVEELGDSVGAMANGKCPGPDGTPIEFFKANWMTVGPQVLTSSLKCITEEHFPAFFRKGAIVLLKKKNDQRMLSNRRPITLLNSIYKIGAKVMQRRLSPLLHNNRISYPVGTYIITFFCLVRHCIDPKPRERSTSCSSWMCVRLSTGSNGPLFWLLWRRQGWRVL